MKVSFFSKCSKYFENSINLEKMLTVLKIVSFELVAGVSVNYDKNTCDGP